MARENDPAGSGPSSTSGASGSTGSSPVAVRRAVMMEGAAQDPGDALAPGGGQRGGTGGQPAAPVTSPNGRREPARAEPDSGRPDTAEGGAPGGAEQSAAQVQEEAAGSATTAAETAAPVVTTTAGSDVYTAEAAPESGGTGVGVGVGEEPPHNRPRKPMLAAAAIVGAILIGVPFIVSAQGDEKERGPGRTENAAGTVLGADRTPSSSDSYATRSPSPSATPGQASKKKEKATEKPAAPVGERQSDSPSPGASEKRAASAAETLRQRANAASSARNIVVRNAATGLCADVPDYGNGVPDGPVNQYSCNSTAADNQLWNLEVSEAKSGPQGASLFLIRNSKDGLCMDLPYFGAVGPQTKVSEYRCAATGDNQLWWLDPRSGGTYWIRSYSSNNLCLGVVGAAAAGNDARLEVGRCDDSDRWIV